MLEGKKASLDIELEGGCHLAAEEFTVSDLTFSLNDASRADVWVSNEARGSLYDASLLDISGDALVDARVSDSSELNVQ